MYEYQKKHTGFGQIQDADAGIFGSGISVQPPEAPRDYPGIVPANVNIFNEDADGVFAQPPAPAAPPAQAQAVAHAQIAAQAQAAAQAAAQAPAQTPAVTIDACASGNCGPQTAAIIPGAIGRPWWHYALLGAGIGAGYLYLRKSGMLRNPDDLSREERIRQGAAVTIQAGIPTILWGPPGIGKTKWIQGLGEAMAPMNGDEPVEVITVIGSTKDPTDISGMPQVKGGYRIPSWAETLRDRSRDGLHSILFLDEFSSITPIVHAALLRVVNEKIAGDESFDPTDQFVHIVMAANRRKHGASAMDLPPPAANRIIHFEWPKPTAFDWARGMLGERWRSEFSYLLPSDWKESPLIDEAFLEISAFLRFYKEVKQERLLFKMPAVGEIDQVLGGKKTGGAWPSPRSWELAGQGLGACLVAGAPMSVQSEVLKGAVGLYAAKRLQTFRDTIRASQTSLEREMVLDMHPSEWPERFLDRLDTSFASFEEQETAAATEQA